jgi:hypothetical protein
MMIGLDNGTHMKHRIFLIFSRRLGRSLPVCLQIVLDYIQAPFVNAGRVEVGQVRVGSN